MKRTFTETEVQRRTLQYGRASMPVHLLTELVKDANELGRKGKTVEAVILDRRGGKWDFELVEGEHG